MIRNTALASFALATLAAADTVTLGSVKDNTLYAESGSESNGKGGGLFSGTNGTGQIRRGLVQFNVAAGVPAGSTITAVQVTLDMTKTNAGAVSVELRRVLQAWGEGNSIAPNGGGGGAAAQVNDATWTSSFFSLTPWSTAGGAFAASASATTTVNQVAAYTWNSTATLVSDVQSFFDTPASNFGWLLLSGDESSAPTAKRFATREWGIASQRPKLVITYTPPSPFTSFCFGDGTGTACPCGNSGAIGSGCATSAFVSGGLLTASGVPGASIATDTLQLTATNVSGPGLFFQGTGNFSGGLGIPFGDGLLCSGGAIARLGVVFPVGTTAIYPGGLTPNPIHIGGATAAGDVRNYQCWYRDAVPFCTASNFNLTQSVALTWLP